MFNSLPTYLLIGLLLVFAGCREKQEMPVVEKAPQVAEEPVEKPTVVHELEVVVPDEVRDYWKSVKIAVRDLEDGTENIYTVDIGGSFGLPQMGLRVTVENFLPAFIMDGQQMTSSSNNPTNPAARIKIMEGEEQVYRGWLFGLYPDTHTFQHPRYNFSLIGYRPAG